MANDLLKLFFVLCLTITVSACRTMQARTYVEDKERVDQEIDGNAGFLEGTPKSEDRSNLKKTRKVYVLEVIKTPPEDVEHSGVSSQKNRTETSHSSEFNQPSKVLNHKSISTSSHSSSAKEQPLNNPTPAVPATVSSEITLPTQYEVQDNDTLQTISKKFYNSYSKWPKIYEANKDKISDPNRIRKGLMLTIPAI